MNKNNFAVPMTEQLVAVLEFLNSENVHVIYIKPYYVKQGSNLIVQNYYIYIDINDLDIVNSCSYGDLFTANSSNNYSASCYKLYKYLVYNV